MAKKIEKIVNRHGEKEEFDKKKIYASVYYPAREAEYSESEAEELAEEVCEDVVDWIRKHEDEMVTSGEIREKTIEELEERDKDVALLYRTHLDVN